MLTLRIAIERRATKQLDADGISVGGQIARVQMTALPKLPTRSGQFQRVGGAS